MTAKESWRSVSKAHVGILQQALLLVGVSVACQWCQGNSTHRWKTHLLAQKRCVFNGMCDHMNFENPTPKNYDTHLSGSWILHPVFQFRMFPKEEFIKKSMLPASKNTQNVLLGIRFTNIRTVIQYVFQTCIAPARTGPCRRRFWSNPIDIWAPIDSPQFVFGKKAWDLRIWVGKSWRWSVITVSSWSGS